QGGRQEGHLDIGLDRLQHRPARPAAAPLRTAEGLGEVAKIDGASAHSTHAELAQDLHRVNALALEPARARAAESARVVEAELVVAGPFALVPERLVSV